ncbi:helix-turn-helix domain-containing protein [Thiohalorhabdus sp.]|uniref:helix-turn-helix domain-containing protein n=1 Tax=Thiohalorhabdus sp. TaxID=3094134 RepID=UPI002FC300F2
MFSPRQTAALLGVSESSVKRWVDRGRIRADRTAGGHRRIHLPELARFVREAKMEIERPDLLGLVPNRSEPEATGQGDSDEFRQALLQGAGDQARTLLIRAFLGGASVPRLIDETLAPALRNVAGLWQRRDDGIFLEHRAVGVCETALEGLRGLLFRPGPDAPVAVGGGPALDPYTLPSHLADTTWQAQGWRPLNLGAFTPVEVMAEAAVTENAEAVWLAVSSAEGPESVGEMAEALVSTLNAAGWRGPVVVGGPACRRGTPVLPAPAYLVPTMVELAAFAKGLSDNRAMMDGRP